VICQTGHSRSSFERSSQNVQSSIALALGPPRKALAQICQMQRILVLGTALLSTLPKSRHLVQVAHVAGEKRGFRQSQSIRVESL
jgi:hypothetical protein